MDSQELIINETAVSQKDSRPSAAETPQDLSVYVPEKVRKPGEIPFAVLWIVIGALGYYFALGMTSDSYSAPSVFPKLASTVIFLCGAVTLVKAVRREKLEEGSPGVFRYLLPQDVLVMITLIILYCVALPNLHFVPSSFCFLVAGMVYLYRGKKIVLPVIVSACTLAVLVAIFRYIFLVMLP